MDPTNLWFYLLSYPAFIFCFWIYFKFWEMLFNSFEDEENIIHNKSIPYENKYIEEVNNLDTYDLSEEKLNNLKQSIVFENTPMGHVIMYYNHLTNSFFYYCDRKDIPYKYLDVVARKYIKVFNCKIIYIHMSDELENSKNKLKELKEKKKDENKNKKEVEKKDVFVKLKNYNVKSEKPIKDEDYLIKENINNFKWSGFLKDYSFLQQSKKNKDASVLSYQDFINTAKFIQNPI
jgi:hypothetical protein